MAHRKQSLVEDLIEITSKFPWWVGVVLAIAAYFWLHSVSTSDVTAVAQAGKMGEFLRQNIFKTLATFGQYVLPFAFLVGAAMSAYGRYKRMALHAQVAGSPDWGALNDMSWQQFEALVGEAFRLKGYVVTETGGGGADGGIDLVLRKEGETFLVQCKQWKAYKVGVSTVRELYGVMAAKAAVGGYVVTSGVFTDEAQAFAAGRNIKLMDGKALHALIRGVSVPDKAASASPAVATASAPACPVCQSVMVTRTAKRGANSGNAFWGCSQYPACKGTRPAR
ncbi:MAG TPA: restriction endonuclease [Thiobacillaceae bacterium]|nr:restriction endonuclease [Thiobacillaceae bacterium]